MEYFNGGKMKQKIKICFHIGNISNCGGTEKVTTQIANLLLENYNYYDICILSNYYNQGNEPFFKGNKKIKYYKLFNKKTIIRLKPFSTIKKINQFIKKENIDILVGVDTILSVFDIPGVKNTNCKYIAWEHFNYYANLGVKLRDYGRKLAAKKADGIVVLTKEDYQNFKNNLKINSKIVQIYNPFIRNNNANVTYKKRDNIILSSGRLTAQKGFDLLVEVAAKVKEEITDFKWIILGEGEDRETLQEKIDFYQLNENVILQGNVENVQDYYNKCKFFVLTSRFEGQVLVVLEAKTNKLPVISFDCKCGPKEMIENNVNGYLISLFNIDEMAQKVIYLLKNDKVCLEMSKNSFINIERFNQEDIIKKWDNFFKEVIK